jgi:hypothetical protein
VKRRHALLATLGAFGSGAAWPAAAGAPLELLRTADIGGWPVLRATIGAREAAWIVDTGASTHAVDARWVASLQLEELAPARLTTITGSRTVRRRLLPAWQAGALDWPASPAVEIDLGPYEALTGVAIGGILGLPLWAGGALVLDLAGRRMASMQAASLDAAVTVPLAFDGGLPVVQLAMGTRAPEPFLLDSGNPGALVVFARRAAELLAQAALPRLRVQEPGGSVEVAHALLDTLQFAGRRLEQVPLALEIGARARRGAHFDRLSGSLGMALFEDGALALDPRAGVLHMRLAPMPLPGGFGFTLRARRGAAQVQAVIDGGPAARAGIAPEDALLALDGAPIADASPADVWSRLRAREQVRLRWQRGGRAQEAQLARERFFPRLR